MKCAFVLSSFIHSVLFILTIAFFTTINGLTHTYNVDRNKILIKTSLLLHFPLLCTVQLKLLKFSEVKIQFLKVFCIRILFSLIIFKIYENFHISTKNAIKYIIHSAQDITIIPYHFHLLLYVLNMHGHVYYVCMTVHIHVLVELKNHNIFYQCSDMYEQTIGIVEIFFIKKNHCKTTICSIKNKTYILHRGQ